MTTEHDEAQRDSGLWAMIQQQLRDEGVKLGTEIERKLRDKLREKGIDLDIRIERFAEGEGGELRKLKVIAVAPSIRDSVEQMGRAQRDQVVMVRVDDETLHALDAWVETGAVRSRSEAAALFIREGLKVRAPELDQLRDALQEVETAKQRLQDKVREVFGSGQQPK
jgi:hypothetical protein